MGYRVGKKGNVYRVKKGAKKSRRKTYKTKAAAKASRKRKK